MIPIGYSQCRCFHLGNTMPDRRRRSDTPFSLRLPHSWGRWIQTAMLGTGTVVVIFYTPFARVFGFESFEARHGGSMLDFSIYMALWIVGKSIYLHLFGRGRIAAEMAAFKDELRHGHVKRMSFAARWLFILCVLGLVCLGWVAPEPHRARILAVAVPLFFLFCAIELNIVVHPGEALLPDPRDELLTFFKSRMLQAGYVASIAALVVLYLTYLFAPAYVGLLLPVGLTACLLVPSVVYNRLDRQAGSDG